MEPKLVQAGTRFLAWMREEALPLWLERGTDAVSGGHYEQLDANGQPDRQAEVRVRVQARQATLYDYTLLTAEVED